MADIYEQHTKAFSNVSAYAVMLDGQFVAKISFKYTRDGVGGLYVYVHWVGLPMGRGYASGYGYDKHSAACSYWARVAVDPVTIGKILDQSQMAAYDKFRAALYHNGGNYWHNRLRDAGFEVHVVI
jgi:hypothetical protein